MEDLHGVPESPSVSSNGQGEVRRPGFARPLTWSDLSAFEQGYVEALLSKRIPNRVWTSIDHQMRFCDLAPETLALILNDCEAWRAEFTSKTRALSAGRADMGREFWRIRQGGLRRTYPPLTPTLADDGKVYLRAARQPPQDAIANRECGAAQP